MWRSVPQSPKGTSFGAGDFLRGVPRGGPLSHPLVFLLVLAPQFAAQFADERAAQFSR